MYNKPQGLLLLLYQDLTEYCYNHPVTNVMACFFHMQRSFKWHYQQCPRQIEVIYEAFGLRFPEHVRTITQLTLQLITDDKTI
jgi:hypothetical protein